MNVQCNVGRSNHEWLGVTLNLSSTVAGFDVVRRDPLKFILIGLQFVRLYLDLIGEVFSGVRPWFMIFFKSVELLIHLFTRLQ